MAREEYVVYQIDCPVHGPQRWFFETMEIARLEAVGHIVKSYNTPPFYQCVPKVYPKIVHVDMP